MRSWRVRGTFGVEVGYDEERGVAYDLQSDKALPASLIPFTRDEEADELIIEFRSSGYYDPGSMYGGRDHLGWPPEGDDERTLDEAYLTKGFGDSLVRIKLPAELQQELFDHFSKRIEEVEIFQEE